MQIVLEGTNEAADRKQRAAQTAASAKAGAEAARKVRLSLSLPGQPFSDPYSV